MRSNAFFGALAVVLALPASAQYLKFQEGGGSAPVHPEATQTAPSGIITTVAGDGFLGESGDGGPATSAQLAEPQSVAVDSAGNLYIPDIYAQVVRKVTASTGIISVYAGTGFGGYSGDGGKATAAQLDEPTYVAVDSNNNLYISDSRNNVVREVSAETGIISTVAGNGAGAHTPGGSYPCANFTAGVPATKTPLCGPGPITIDGSNNLYIAVFNQVVKVTKATGVLSLVAGTYVNGYSGDGGPAVDASLSEVEGMATDIQGNLYIADTQNCAIRKVTALTGYISSLVGTVGSDGYGECNFGNNPGDGGPASKAVVLYPEGVAVDRSGNVFISDSGHFTIREIAASGGYIYTIAGSYSGAPAFWYGNFGYWGDGGPGALAELGYPEGLALDSSGNLYIADQGNDVIRKLTGAAALPIDGPVFTTGSATFAKSTTVTLESPVGGTVYYTTNGTMPTTGSTRYTGSFTLSNSAVVYAFSADPGGLNSTVSQGVGLWTPAPAVSPGSENITAPVQVKVTDSNPGALIYYTDTAAGTDPTQGGGTKYAGPVTVSTTTGFRAAGLTTITDVLGNQFSAWSPVTTEDFLYAPAPVVTPGTESFTAALKVTITENTGDADILYTVDGSDPTISGSAIQTYNGSLTITGTTTLKVVAWTWTYTGNGSSYVSVYSPVVTRTYTLTGAPTAITEAATPVTAGGAVLNGSVTANTGTAKYWFSYGTSMGALTKSTPQTGSLTGTTARSVSATLTGLAAKTTYYYVVNASNATGTTTGEVMAFATQ